jgi:hypothetical protein
MLGTTEADLGAPTPDQLAASVEGVVFGVQTEHTFQGSGSKQTQ